MYEYLVGDSIMGVVWVILFFVKKDLRKPMIWSGVIYFFAITIWYIGVMGILALQDMELSRTLTPGYWEPRTLFNIGMHTKGYAIEDILFMFFVGGIATNLYELVFKKRILFSKTSTYHIRAIVIGIIASFIFAWAVPVNLMYSLIVFGFAGAIIILLERKDLIPHSLYGGFLFGAIYFLGFLLFNVLFPYFIDQVYHLENISGILLLGVPIEEILYAIGYGMLWAPLYEYEHGEKVA